MAGVVKNDRILAADVRKLSMNLILRYLNGPDEEFRKQLILKLATNVLPRINEHSGPDGGEIHFTPIYAGQSTKAPIPGHNSNSQDIQPNQEN